MQHLAQITAELKLTDDGTEVDGVGEWDSDEAVPSYVQPLHGLE